MRSLILGFSIGVALLQMQAQLPALEWYAVGLTLAVLLGLSAWKFWQPFLRIPLLLTCGAWIGFLWAAAFAHYYLEQELLPAWEGRDVVVMGTVAGLPDRVDRGVRFRFDVDQVVVQDGQLPVVPPRLSLAWYADRDRAQPVEDGEQTGGAGLAAGSLAHINEIQPGSRWRLKVRLKRPHGNANPEGFDYEVFLLQDDVRATGYVRNDAQAVGVNRRLEAFVWSPSNVVEYGRGWLRDHILSALPNQPYAGVLVALVIGDQRAISQSDWSIFNRTGIGHLMAISGLHITLLAGMFAGLASWLWRRSFFTRAQLPLRVPAQKVGIVAGLLAAVVYVFLAGFGVPAQRTLYMLIVVGLAFWFGRLTRVSTILCLALGAVLLFDPWAVLWPGFWLSFGAVALILYASVGRMTAEQSMRAARRTRWWHKSWRAIRSGAHAQYVVTLGLVPLTLLLFGQYSLVSPLANAIAIPLVTLLVTPLALLGSVLPGMLAQWVLLVPHQLLEWLAMFLQWLDSLPFAVWETPLPSWWMFLLALIGTVLLLAPRGWPARWLGLFGWLPLVLNAPLSPEDGSMRVTALDVGQGMALLIETPGHRLLYDTGPYYTPQSDAGNRVILPYLRARGIDHLDRVVVSHNDNDHSGGALSIFKGIAVDSVYSSLSASSPIVKAAPRHQRCVAGQSWNWDGIGFSMLHPTAASYDSEKWRPNARSCVLKVQIGRQSILLAGDIEAIQEDELVNGPLAEQLQSTVLLAPHHGSGTSSTLPFLRAVRPEIALFQVGYRNRFNHPKAEVVERYRQLGIRRLRTDESGAVTFSFGDQLETSEYRREHQRYWYGR
jgi:competence protein ComEC